MASKNTRFFIYGGVALVAVIGFLFSAPVTQPGIEEAKRAKKPRSSSKSGIEFTKEDMEARFQPVNFGLKNAFVPLVARTGSGGGAPNEFSTSLTGGEPGWFYTGSVVVDEVPSVLIENQTTGEGLYLRVGEKFKSVTISQIAPSYLIVSTSSGRQIKMNLLEDSAETEEAPYRGTTVEPVRPSVPTGAIGGTTSFPNLNIAP